jgi:hypothetical protein
VAGNDMLAVDSVTHLKAREIFRPFKAWCCPSALFLLFLNHFIFTQALTKAHLRFFSLRMDVESAEWAEIPRPYPPGP